MDKRSAGLKALRAAFPYTLPIFASFWFLGFAYGVYMNASGFDFVYPMLMSITIFGGSLEYLAVSMLTAPFAPLQTFIVALMVQARHLFYGLSMLEKYKGTGKLKPYLIFGLCDESFSINYAVDAPEGVDRSWFMFFVTLLDQLYWVTGSTLGGLFGTLISFNTKGLSFIMTAMFVAIFMEIMKKETQPVTAAAGIASAVICRLLFGADAFLIPTMLTILAALTVMRKPIERMCGE